MPDPTQDDPTQVAATAPTGRIAAGSRGIASLGAPVPADELLAPGTVIARFIVLRALGAGGASVVYAAHDPELGRTVALKVLRREVALRADARARFLREAQALARLSHPNVISVYDVGAADGRTFIAMEYIHGWTFADWLASYPRSWSQIVAVLVKAGRGLAAAHAAGLIHRDFKPANLLVGDDGRVGVTDFGLARAVEGVDTAATLPGALADHDHRDAPPEAALAAAITRTGAVQGTPGYMAPEQQHGGPADARSDQFSFCITLHEAIFGVHPFLPQRTFPKPSNARSVPKWLRRTVQHGLRESPEDRYPSMDGLLHALVHEPVRRRRRALIGIAAAALVGGGVAIYAIADPPGVGAELCGGAASQLASIWNPGVRGEIRTAFAATQLAYAPDTWDRVAPLLDTYAARWTAMHTEACRATRVRGEQSEMLMDRRIACLDVRRSELDRLTRLLLHPDADVLEHAVQAARGLSPIQSCGDVAALIRPMAMPSDAVKAARVSALREQLAEARVLHSAGKYAEGLALVGKLAAEPIASEYLPLRAEIAYLMGQLHASKTEWAPALARLQDAIWAAEASGHDEIAVGALGGAAAALADLDRFKETEDIIRRGEAALLRSASAPLQRAEFRANVCHALYRQGQFREAREQCQQALELRRSELGPEHPLVAASLFFLALQAGRTAGADSHNQALGYLREARAIQDKALGAEHPELVSTLNAMSETERRLGRPDDALVHGQQALGIAERALGPDNMRLSQVLRSVGTILRQLHREADAEAIYRRALTVAERAVGPEHSQTGIAHAYLGDVLQERNNHAEALQHYQRAEAILTATVGTGHMNYALVVLTMCSMQLDLKRPRSALPACTRGLAGLERALGPDAPDVADALVRLIDRVYAANGMIREAVASLERGIAIWPKGDPTASARIADGELTLAQTMWEYAPSHRARARTLAARAHHRLRDAGPEHGAERDAAAAWLAAHR